MGERDTQRQMEARRETRRQRQGETDPEIEEKQRRGEGDGDGQRRGVAARLERLSQTARSAGPARAVGVLPGGLPARDPSPGWVCKELWGITLRLWGACQRVLGLPSWVGDTRAEQGRGAPRNLGHSILTLALGRGLSGSLCLSLSPVSTPPTPAACPEQPQVAFTVHQEPAWLILALLLGRAEPGPVSTHAHTRARVLTATASPLGSNVDEGLSPEES